MQEHIQSIFNIDMPSDAYEQSTLPLKFGGIGIRSTNSLALSAFIASFQAAKCIRPEIQDIFDEYISNWKLFCSEDRIPLTQKELVFEVCKVVQSRLISNSSSQVNTSRLISVKDKIPVIGARPPP